MKRMVSGGLAAILAVSGISSAFAADPKTAVQAITPTQIQTAGEKVQKITFLQDDAQFNIVSKVYELKHTKAADLAPFVKSARSVLSRVQRFPVLKTGPINVSFSSYPRHRT